MLAHGALGLPGGPGGEVDVGQLAQPDLDAEVTAVVAFGVGGAGEHRLDPGQRAQRGLQRGGAAQLGQHQAAAGPAQRGRDAVGWEVRLDRQVHPAGFEHREHRGHPVQVAPGHHRDHVFPAQATGQQRPAQLVGPGIQLPVGPLPAAAAGRDRVRVGGRPLLEQLMDRPAGQLTGRPGEPVELEAQFARGQQAAPARLGVRVGGHQLERSPVIASDPRRGVRVQHARPVAQPQHQLAAARRGADPQRGARGERIPAPAGRVEHGLVARPGRAQLPPERGDREALVGQQLRLGLVGAPQQRPPRARGGAQPAGQRPPIRDGVAGHDLGLAGQRGQHPGVPGQQHRAERQAQLGGQPAQRRQDTGRHRGLIFHYARGRAGGPPRDRGGPARGQHPAPVLAGGRIGLGVAQAGGGHVSSLAGFPPQRACAGISSPFIRNESGASTEPSPMVTP